MEEMSKKTKRLEKENATLTRKHDLTNRNILEMAEERTRATQELEALRKKNEKLTGIINQMQKQGRGLPQGVAGMVEDSAEGEYGEGDPEGTESEYEYEDEDEDEEGSDVGDFDEDTEEEVHTVVQQPFGPVPPPPPPPQSATNGMVTIPNGISY
jgi:Myosin-like coiled-coil protein